MPGPPTRLIEPQKSVVVGVRLRGRESECDGEEHPRERDAGGRELRATVIAVADAIAGAADLARGKDSGEPAVLVRGLGEHVGDGDGHGAAALRRPLEEDLFR